MNFAGLAADIKCESWAGFHHHHHHEINWKRVWTFEVGNYYRGIIGIVARVK